jgi:hypothetical protein
MVSRLVYFVTLAAFAKEALAVGTPFGQAAGTTGGGSATAQVPSSLAELTSWLSDGTARVILLDKIYDFTSAEGTATGTACKPWTCSPNPQVSILLFAFLQLTMPPFRSWPLTPTIVSHFLNPTSATKLAGLRVQQLPTERSQNYRHLL